MNETIFKFTVPPVPGKTVISLPWQHAELTAQLQGGAIAIWFQVVPDSDPQDKLIHVVATGSEVPERSRYLASVQAGPFVWHIYTENIADPDDEEEEDEETEDDSVDDEWDDDDD